MSNYTKDTSNRANTLSVDEVAKIAITVQEIQKNLDTISIPTLASKIGITKQALHSHIAKIKKGGGK